MNKNAVIYGGGNIGRGFIGQLFYESGYETVFIDVNKELITQLNEKKEYPIKFVDNKSSSEIIIKNVRGIDGSSENINEVTDVISKADIMATSVGVNVLKFIMEPVAKGINKRFADGNYKPLNILLCENLIHSDKIMRDGVYEYIDYKFKSLYNEKIGFIEVSVGRMVPIQTDDMKAGNPLRIVTENYRHLHVDKDAFKGEIPEIKDMIAYSPFEYLIERKLYIHNMGHAVCAYLGDMAGYDYIWQAIEDPYIEMITTKTMQRSALALSKIYHANAAELMEFIENLIYRFANKALGDTVKRVGNDLKRKLSPNDRLIGVYRICAQNSLPVNYICLAIAAAVNFKGDKFSGYSADGILKEAGSYNIIAENSNDFALITKYDKAIKSGLSAKGLLDIVKDDENIINSDIM
ncbi:MAG: mannitol dehydrogenase [Oscillospiraceae bacterium]|nr:mannitol dehydrogenase [Oscillospiraceae bacterium]